MNETAKERLYNEAAAQTVLDYLYEHDMYSLAEQFCVECPYPNVLDPNMNIHHKPLRQIMKEFFDMQTLLQELVNLCSSVITFPHTESTLVLVEYLIDMLKLIGTADVLDAVITAQPLYIESEDLQTTTHLQPTPTSAQSMQTSTQSTPPRPDDVPNILSSTKITPILVGNSSTPVNKRSAISKISSVVRTDKAFSRFSAGRSSSCPIVMALSKESTNASLVEQEPQNPESLQANKVTPKHRLTFQPEGHTNTAEDSDASITNNFSSNRATYNSGSCSSLNNCPGSPEFIDPLTVYPLTPRYLNGSLKSLSMLSPWLGPPEGSGNDHNESPIHSKLSDISTPDYPTTPGSSIRTACSAIPSTENFVMYYECKAPKTPGNYDEQEDFTEQES